MTVVEKMRKTLISLRGENTVIRSSQHSPAEDPAVPSPPQSMPLSVGNGLRPPGVAAAETQREGLVLLGMDEGCVCCGEDPRVTKEHCPA